MMRPVALALLALVAISSAKRASKTAHSKSPDHWIIYRPHQFKASELCEVLNCRRVEVCLVRDNNALCVNKHRMDRVEGPKVELEEASTLSARPQPREKALKTKAEQAGIAPAVPVLKAKTSKAKSNRVSERHSHEHEGEVEKDCSAKELRDMGGRLLQWFSDVHTVTTEGKPTHLGHHRVSCRQDVGWMFSQLDGNDDGFLSVKELFSLEHDRYETCIRPFLDRCDAARPDDRLSVDEWCDCFNFADKMEREEPPCHARQHASDPHLLGAWVPRCDADGFFRPEQCSEGVCWCADRWGREFDHSRAHARADCGQYADHEDDEDLDETMGSSGAHEL